MAVLTRREYETRQSKKPVKDETVKAKPAKAEIKNRALTVLSVLQDPETRTFKDTIKIKGREIVRECNNGIIKTSDPDLIALLKKNGWLLLDTVNV